ncbi:enhancer of mRNA-decapping protein 3 [Anopheles bellator]|uniref:enhancer of mRNA-decapping protein 3 n=1 Tax=Anopheles bellator TaxID=139047 RepID=UPI002647B81E|nr:enhancer of mRNA-decapping protein 3 [Anopheles bellator]
MMAEKWVGKSVSIHCRNNIGIFQGIIKRVTPSEVAITKAVRNGIPLKQNNVEVTLKSSDILKFDLIACSNVPSIPSKAIVVANTSMTTSLDDQFDELKLSNNQGKQQLNGLVGTLKQATKSPAIAKLSNNSGTAQVRSENGQGSSKSSSTPIDISGGARVVKTTTSASVPMSSVSFGYHGNGRPGAIEGGSFNSKKNGTNGKAGRSRKNLAKDSTFGSPDDDPVVMDEEFDFEKNLALFDKQAIWNEIDAIQTKASESAKRQAPSSATKTKYRHDENVLASTPAQYRPIEMVCPTKKILSEMREYVTDEGVVIPTVPDRVRTWIEYNAERDGLTRERQNDFLARGATELALQLLGGSRRLTPNNQHQWPKIVIIIDEAPRFTKFGVDKFAASFNPTVRTAYSEEERLSDVGYTTARLLASHGLQTTVCCFNTARTVLSEDNTELKLYKSTGNKYTDHIGELSACDLVIVAASNPNPSLALRKWITDSRAPVLAIDPPVTGIQGVPIKCSILPILPISGIQDDACGRLYLCNIGIPTKYFNQSELIYASPFDKFVIPIHRQKDD